ncbi:Regulator of cytoskeleton and endocytosis [Golovinomyces cichoracearum]|uniref:Regulator of cytoskeleton and endocytosis n=1 Tax=Golovinomyces cichoracearum TaxID=62708 RepID=A0A420IE66_9PEZI|nr:Regulator of cytoskeleton and endocytosis [Golovinomyces cichoracearum]
MKSVNRQFGKLMRKNNGDTTNIAVLLSDFEEADKILSKFIEACKAWRDSWVSILSVQLASTSMFKELYEPIMGTNERNGPEPIVTPVEKLDRVQKLQLVQSELKSDLLEEVKIIDCRIIKPAVNTKELIQPMKKIIKKRENKRLDWDTYVNRVDGYLKKMKRTDRENSALIKAEEDMAQAANTLKIADDHLREILPPIISAALSVLPHLTEAQIMVQTSLLAHSYTALHNYLEEVGLQSMTSIEEILVLWSKDSNPIQKKVEAIDCIARGKFNHQPTTYHLKGSTIIRHNPGNDTQNRRLSGNATVSSQHSIPMLETASLHISSSKSQRTSPISPTSSQERGTALPPPKYASRENSSQLSSKSNNYTHSPIATNVDHIQRSTVGKKRPPPPPPPKRKASQKPDFYVTALYSFEGQNEGDLSFQEGDVIKVVKKTASSDDWWEGTLRGIQGSFPANYCKSD